MTRNPERGLDSRPAVDYETVCRPPPMEKYAPRPRRGVHETADRHGRVRPGLLGDRPRLRKAIKVTLIAVAVFVAVLALTFPTEHLVRRVLGSVPLPAGRAITFERARLRPWGLTLDGAAYRRRDGSALADAEWIRLRPSWMSLGGAGFGSPWRVTARLFGGELDARLDVGSGGDAIDVSWTDFDLGRLLVAMERQVLLAGRSTGRAALKVPRGELPSGEGEVTVRAGVWEPPLPALDGVQLHADDATLEWALGQRRLEVTRLDLHGDEIDLSAKGVIRIAPQFGRSDLALRVTIAALPDAPDELLEVLENLPRRADDVFDFRLVGTIDAPQIARP